MTINPIIRHIAQHEKSRDLDSLTTLAHLTLVRANDSEARVHELMRQRVSTRAIALAESAAAADRAAAAFVVDTLNRAKAAS